MSGEGKLTEAQKRTLAKLGGREDDLWCNYGTACGVQRRTVIVLTRLKLAEYKPTELGVTARITPAGRAALAAHEARTAARGADGGEGRE